MGSGRKIGVILCKSEIAAYMKYHIVIFRGMNPIIMFVSKDKDFFIRFVSSPCPFRP